LTALQKQYGPFAQAAPASFAAMTHMVLCDVDSRLSRVHESTDREWLDAVVRDGDVQLRVRMAAKTRLRKLVKPV
jgi:hypothetical protein